MDKQNQMDIIKVAATSNVNSVAGSIALGCTSDTGIYVQAIGANSVNQAVKAIATARGYLAPKNQDLNVRISYVELKLREGTKTAMRFELQLVEK